MFTFFRWYSCCHNGKTSQKLREQLASLFGRGWSI